MKAKQIIFSSILIVAAFVVGYAVFKLYTFGRPDLSENNPAKYMSDNEINYNIYPPEIPENLTFAGEKVPVEWHDVYESLDRELMINTFWQNSTFLSIKRAGRYFPVIEPILKRNNVPDDFKYLAVAESGLDNVVSPAGATGFWQFMKATAKGYNIEMNNDVDERYHLEKSTQAACEYLNKAYQRFGNWALVAAAYNAGSGGVGSQLKAQNVNSYYDLLLNSETARYVYRLIALKLIMSAPEKYGFAYENEDLYHPINTKKLVVDSSITNLADFAEYHKTSYEILKILNPWMISDKLINKSKKEYEILIPADGVRAVLR